MTTTGPARLDVRGVILAAGRGRRLGAIAADRPKPLVPVLNRPIVHWIAEDLARGGIRRVAMNVHHLAERMEQWVATTGSSILDLETVREQVLSGPAGGLLAVADRVADADAVVVVSGDACTALDFGPLVDQHFATHAAMTIVATVVADPRRFGQLRVERDGTVGGMVRDPAVVLPDRLVSTGMYVLSPAAFDTLHEIQGTVPDLDFDRHLVPAMFGRGRVVMAYKTGAYWSDVGLPEALVEANLTTLESDRVSRVAQPCPGSGPQVWCQGNHLAVEGVLRGRVLLGAGTVVARGASVSGPAVLGPGTVVSTGADLERCLTLADTVVPPGVHRSMIYRARAKG